MSLRKTNKFLGEATDRLLNEATEVEFKNLPAEAQKKVKKIERATKSKATYFFSGAFGIIAGFEMKGMMHQHTRFEEPVLKKIMKIGIRWLEGQKLGDFVVGF